MSYKSTSRTVRFEDPRDLRKNNLEFKHFDCVNSLSRLQNTQKITLLFQIKKGLVQTRSLPSPPPVTPPSFQHSISQPDDRVHNDRKYISLYFSFLKAGNFYAIKSTSE